MKSSIWYEYVLNLIGKDSPSEAASKTGINKSAFSRWKNGLSGDPQTAVKLARVYNGNVLEALVSVGLITEKEAELNKVWGNKPDILDSLSIIDLIQEIQNKLETSKLEKEPESALKSIVGAVIAKQIMKNSRDGK